MCGLARRLEQLVRGAAGVRVEGKADEQSAALAGA
jgi:hypothetical protein